MADKKMEMKYRLDMRSSYDVSQDWLVVEIRIDDKLRELLKSVCLATKKKLDFGLNNLQRYVVKKYAGTVLDESSDFILFSLGMVDGGKVELKFETARNLIEFMRHLREAVRKVLKEIALMNQVCDKSLAIDITVHETGQ
jgi:hypothetical protein